MLDCYYLCDEVNCTALELERAYYDKMERESIEYFYAALKKVLEQFKVDKYDGDPAKHREKIDARCHSGCKARILAFLKNIGLIYEDGIIYKASLKKMDEMLFGSGCIFLCGSTAVPEERIPPIRRQETAVPEQGYRT